MPVNDYQFFTEWRVNAPRELLYEILKEGKDYPSSTTSRCRSN